MIKNYYTILKVDKKASDAEIKKAFRELALKLHPDKNKEADAHERFVEINEAFQMLSDAEKRKQYDAVLVYPSKKKQSSSVTESDLTNINAWAEEGRRKGMTYSHSPYNDFATDVLRDIYGNMVFNGIVEGLGSIIDLANDAIDNLLDD